MHAIRDLDLINELLAQPAETAWLEFKGRNADPEMIGKRCSALSNAARLEGRDFAYLIWGVEDETHAILGTDFNPDTKKIGGQVLPLWLANSLQPSIAFSFRTVQHTDGRLVLLEIPAATGAPVAFNGVPYIRIGSATPKLTDYPLRYQQLIERLQPYRWEQGIARQYASGDEVLNLLDYSQYFRLTKQPLPDNRSGIFDKLEADRLIMRDVGERWNITNLGAILFATRLSDFDAGLARKAVRFVAYGGKNRAATVTHRHDGQKGYAIGFEGLVSYLNDLLPKNERDFSYRCCKLLQQVKVSVEDVTPHTPNSPDHDIRRLQNGTGKLVRTKIGKSHLRRRKPGRVKRLFDEYMVVTHRGSVKRVRRLAPSLWKNR